MAQSTTQLANLALQRAQCGKRLNSFDSDSGPEANLARDCYEMLRDMMLRENLWNFAKKRVQLAELAVAPVFGYNNAYGLPSDCLRIIAVHPYDSDMTQVKYRVETVSVAGTDTPAIITDTEQAYLRYVKRVEAPAAFTADFYDALAWRMSVEFASGIKKSAQLAAQNMKAYNQAISIAKGTGGIEDWPEDYHEGSWSRARDHDSGTWGDAWGGW